MTIELTEEEILYLIMACDSSTKDHHDRYCLHLTDATMARIKLVAALRIEDERKHKHA